MNQIHIQQLLFVKYFIEAIQKQQTTEQSILKEFSQRIPSVASDGIYSERRRKNNEAAKRSRDTRRVKEDEIALR
jgi:hypothetical protein